MCVIVCACVYHTHCTIQYVSPVLLETNCSTSCSGSYCIHPVYTWMMLCHDGENPFGGGRKRLEIFLVVGYIILSHTCVRAGMGSCDFCHVDR